MISKAERDSIKKVLGGHYSALVQEELFKKGIRNRNGLPHSKSQITNVMNGQPDTEIEAAIYEAVETKNKAEEAEKKRRERILAKTKTEAATSV
tara:strand:+ start:32411 stop:32692 length:282 start_codon:yes stop_codon:yes gene_type:complete